MTMADDLLAAITRRPGNTPPEYLAVLRAAGHEVDGDYALELQPNIIVWLNMSKEATDAFGTLKVTRAAHMHPLTSQFEAFLVHSADGQPMPRDLPYCRKPPKGGYKKPHWLGSVWHPGSSKDCASCIKAGWT